MGTQFLDQYSILHWAGGVVAYFWGIPLNYWFIAHFAFEMIENTVYGMRFINTVLTWWPGGKPRADSIINIFGDNISGLLGWICASKLDEIGKIRGWYNQ